ncbi:pyridoxal phosphate-dependent decarboxylase family protein [Corynebacterium glucuronolyticum]|uniref:pyridoxal phosphate-dependent decarboxylase family protein n=1 Tax=Corynebacterium glucuronolyticum TaxID=39791 RepID=UPI0021AF4134|nr:aminotransferase class I/II-fold pyridoxal phosphate-dependent enzyme [Corynebacterium glucuronolyticum]MCT1441434.1 aminotransferase class I/II-fold pyridoxal phosphate-dependent enzyme [Corynebacterium glucuronolyticum]
MTSNPVTFNPRVPDLATEFIGSIFNDYDPREYAPGADFLTRQEDRKKVSPAAIPAVGRPLTEATKELVDVLEHDSNLRHPRFFGFIPGPAQSVSWLGDVIATAYNPHASNWAQSPGASALEKQVLDWACEAVGISNPNRGGILVSGGSMANLTGLMAARESRISLDDIPRARVYTTEQTHSSVNKALRIIGVRPRILPVDEHFRMQPELLRSAIESDIADGLLPLAVVGTCGTTNTGAIDPLDAIADICEEFNLWFHVDGAYGGSVVLSSHRDNAHGVERCDSMAWDGHKWLYQTYGLAMLLVKDRADLVRAFSAGGEYLQDVEGGSHNPDWWDMGPELTRPARAPRLWLTLQTVGTERLTQMIDSSIAVAELFEKEIATVDGISIVTPACNAIVTFTTGSEKRNVQLAEYLRRHNIAGIWTTTLNDKNVLRLCTISPDETPEDMEALVKDIRKALEIIPTQS